MTTRWIYETEKARTMHVGFTRLAGVDIGKELGGGPPRVGEARFGWVSDLHGSARYARRHWSRGEARPKVGAFHADIIGNYAESHEHREDLATET